MSEIYLSQLKEGESCIIKSLEISDSMRYRLNELGFISGSYVTCLQRSFSGDPTAYFVKGTVIALRKNDTSRIKIAVS
ncbi:MAG: ferrous iron transport protein A [Ruminococcus sp.]|nr:ferrous iron transport protein A [Ruminococcus sp.]MDE7098123.1 ferrous iron transport protein A [Ruminococcus sp.]MDE7363448.1 ferrous iron transport protein A [Ruminococcus sp.]